MEPLTALLSALVGGAIAASQDVAGSAIRDAYDGLKNLIVRKFGKNQDMSDALGKVEQRPESQPRRDTLREELALANADRDEEVLAVARQLLDLLGDQPWGSSYSASNTGSGAIAQGPGAKAAGQGGVVADNISGSNVVTGSGNTVGNRNVSARNLHGPVATGDNARQISAQTYIEQMTGMPLSEPTAQNQRTIRILFLAANPSDTDQLRLDEESRALDQALRLAEFRDRFEVRQHWAVRIDDLQELLLRHQPDIVHFSGHGSAASELVLQDADGRTVVLPQDALSNLFGVLRDNVRCVVLNACYSQEQAAGIAEHIDCVIGMSTAITDDAARQFAIAFYRALGYGRCVDKAFELGRSQLDLSNLNEADKPQLLGRADPSQVCFVE